MLNSTVLHTPNKRSKKTMKFKTLIVRCFQIVGKLYTYPSSNINCSFVWIFEYIAMYVAHTSKIFVLTEITSFWIETSIYHIILHCISTKNLNSLLRLFFFSFCDCVFFCYLCVRTWTFYCYLQNVSSISQKINVNRFHFISLKSVPCSDLA